MIDRRAALPAVGRLLARDDVRALVARWGRDAVLDALRSTIDRSREGELEVDPEALARSVVEGTMSLLASRGRGTLVRVINATGVLLHTNLGRASLAEAARRAIVEEGSRASSLEWDLETGERGSRHVHAAERLRRLTGAEDALVANNAAAALLLALSSIAGTGAVVIVSRGELVEIGGAFRIPDVVRTGGARLVEVGTTNRTRSADYARALSELGETPAVLLKVHRSNFAMIGFTEETSIESLVGLADARTPRPPVVHDLGSGLLVDGASVGLPDEPDVSTSIRAGADVVVFSGDKLLGGPQAGLAVGRRAPLATMRDHPLMRALRAGKLVLGALDATLALYERGVAREEVPVLRALVASAEELRERAAELAEALAAEVVPSIARVGGGAQPLAELPSYAASLADPHPERLAAELRRGDPVVVGRVHGERLLLDTRTVVRDELASIVRAVLDARRRIASGSPGVAAPVD